jgi:hypothetical protein
MLTGMTLGIVSFDVCELGSILESWDIPVQMSHPLM